MEQHYMTRHLEALSDLNVGGSDYVTKGQRFFATPVDADYYISRRKAKEVDMTKEPFAAEPSVPESAQVVEQVVQSAPEPVQAEPVAEEPAFAPVADQVAAEEPTSEQPSDAPEAAEATEEAEAEELEAADDVGAETPAAAPDAAPAPRRRGRPPGSTNRKG